MHAADLQEYRLLALQHIWQPVPTALAENVGHSPKENAETLRNGHFETFGVIFRAH
jgi:hypothetical protein